MWKAWEEGLPLTGVSSMGEHQPGDGGAGQVLRLEQEVSGPWAAGRRGLEEAESVSEVRKGRD